MLEQPHEANNPHTYIPEETSTTVPDEVFCQVSEEPNEDHPTSSEETNSAFARMSPEPTVLFAAIPEDPSEAIVSMEVEKPETVQIEDDDVPMNPLHSDVKQPEKINVQLIHELARLRDKPAQARKLTVKAQNVSEKSEKIDTKQPTRRPTPYIDLPQKRAHQQVETALGRLSITKKEASVKPVIRPAARDTFLSDVIKRETQRNEARSTSIDEKRTAQRPKFDLKASLARTAPK